MLKITESCSVRVCQRFLIFSPAVFYQRSADKYNRWKKNVENRWWIFSSLQRLDKRFITDKSDYQRSLSVPPINAENRWLHLQWSNSTPPALLSASQRFSALIISTADKCWKSLITLAVALKEIEFYAVSAESAFVSGLSPSAVLHQRSADNRWQTLQSDSRRRHQRFVWEIVSGHSSAVSALMKVISADRISALISADKKRWKPPNQRKRRYTADKNLRSAAAAPKAPQKCFEARMNASRRFWPWLSVLIGDEIIERRREAPKNAAKKYRW